MITLTDVGCQIYTFPDDAASGEAAFLALLTNEGESWVSMYGLTLQPFFTAVKQADAAGVVFHLLLDHTQATGHAEAPLVKDLAASLTHGEVTITTSSVGGNIWHDKALVVQATDGGDPWIWWGSVNISADGFQQGNIAMLLRSKFLADALIERFERQRDWARLHEPQYETCLLPAACPTEK